MHKKTLKNDKYKKSRGGNSRLLDLSCANCGNIIFSYQKDGPGILKRLYVDRIQENKSISNKELRCTKCKEMLGIYTMYKKENRPCFRLFSGAIAKKIKKS